MSDHKLIQKTRKKPLNVNCHYLKTVGSCKICILFQFESPKYSTMNIATCALLKKCLSRLVMWHKYMPTWTETEDALISYHWNGEFCLFNILSRSRPYGSCPSQQLAQRRLNKYWLNVTTPWPGTLLRLPTDLGWDQQHLPVTAHGVSWPRVLPTSPTTPLSTLPAPSLGLGHTGLARL